MPTVKIFLSPNETEEDAKEALIKALTQAQVKSEHVNDFHQPAAQDVLAKLVITHDKMFKKLIKEISEVIDEEVE